MGIKMTDARTEARWDHLRDLRKHDWRPGDPLPLYPTDEQIAAEIERLEREIREAATNSQAACKHAMAIIEIIMADLGVPMHKEKSDAA